jgi:hypothetical protein
LEQRGPPLHERALQLLHGRRLCAPKERVIFY